MFILDFHVPKLGKLCVYGLIEMNINCISAHFLKHTWCIVKSLTGFQDAETNKEVQA
jgi:hypothetical protein